MEGRQLDAVIFVMDYLQLQFDSSWYLNIYSWPQIQYDGTIFNYSTSGYRNALCGFIASIVKQAEEEPNDSLTLSFVKGVIKISLREDCNGPEAAMLTDRTSGEWEVWNSSHET